MKPLRIISLCACRLLAICLIFLLRSTLQAADDKLALSSSTNLLTRIFKVNTNTFWEGLENVEAIQGDNASKPAGSAAPDIPKRRNDLLRDLFTNVGVDLRAPKSVFYNSTNDTLIVCATAQDLDIVEQAVQVLSIIPPQVNIRAKFLEMEDNGKGDPLSSVLSSLSPQPKIWLSSSTRSNSVRPLGTNNPTFTAILTPAQLRVAFRALELRQDTELLSAPDATTISGRQAHIGLVDIRTIVTGEEPKESPFGPKLDVVPYVSADGFTVNMMLIPTVTEFVGYQKLGRVPAKLAREKFVKTEPPLPIYRERQVVTSATVWDGQTIVIGGFPSENVTYEAGGSKTRKRDPKAQKRRLYVFITPTIIDPAGNRVHSDQQIPTREPYPPQQPISPPTPR